MILVSYNRKSTHVVHPAHEQGDNQECPNDDGTSGTHTVGENLEIDLLNINFIRRVVEHTVAIGCPMGFETTDCKSLPI